MSLAITQTLDWKGLSCPLPVVKTSKAMRDVESGDIVEVLATDPGSVPDFTAWCTSTGNQLISWNREDGIFHFLIRKR